MSRRILRAVGLTLVALIALGALLAFIPAGTGGLDVSAPHPVADYKAAAAAVAADTAKQAAGRDPLCSTGILSPGRQTDRVVVLVHDLGTCPLQYIDLAKQLQAQGYTVYTPLLPRHGRAQGGSDNLADLTPEELRDYADHIVDVAVGLGKKVYVVGTGAGGVVAAWIAEQRKDVAGVVVVSPTFGIGEVPGFVSTGTMNLLSRLPNLNVPLGTSLDHAYSGTSTRGAVAVYRLGQSVLDVASLSRPLVLQAAVVANEGDSSVPNDQVKSLVSRWRRRGADIQFVAVPSDLGLPHDMIDPRAEGAATGIVYPMIEQLLRGAMPAAPIVSR
jgi:esterase/lipase